MNAKQKRNGDKFGMEWIKDNAFALVWLLLFFAAVFNVGYFLTLDLKYIGFLSVSDYYAGTMIYLGLMLLVAFGLCLSFNLRTKNTWVQAGRAFLFWMKNIIHLFRCNVSLIYEKWQIKIMLKKMQEYGTKRYIQIWTKRTKKLEDKILSIKNEIIGLQKTAVKNILNILITIGFLSLISFLVFYDIYILSGLKPAIVMVALFIGGLCMDSLVSNALMRKIVLVIIIAAFTTALGYSVLMRDLQRSNIQICAETDCFYLVRKIEKGYFVTNTTELLFLDNELNIKTRQKM